MSRVECRQSGNSFISVQMRDVINPTGAPFRIGGYAQQDYKNIQRSRNSNCDEHYFKKFAAFEVIFCCVIGYTFKADKRPRRQERNHYNLA